MKVGDKLGDWQVVEIHKKYRVLLGYIGEEWESDVINFGERKQVRIGECKNKEEIFQECIKSICRIERDLGYRKGKKEIQDNFVSLLGIKTDFE